MEFSFLTIIISLAVCSLLTYAVFQYMKVRLNILEHSHKEQALVLQQFIEESSTDIHRLYKLHANNGNQSFQPNDSIILEYATNFNNNNQEYTESAGRQSSYNQPHMIHLDTALFQNKRSNLIEISSDSEDTTDSESESESGSGSESGSESESESGSESGSESESESENEHNRGNENGTDSEKIYPVIVDENMVSNILSDIVDISCETNEPSIPEFKLITLDLGVVQEDAQENTIKSSPERPNDVLSVLYKKSTNEMIEPQPQGSDVINDPPSDQPSTTAVHPISYSTMSVPELRTLLKDKYKKNPEKHTEIQKLKKAELIYALQQA
jgi:hypothetical protein